MALNRLKISHRSRFFPAHFMNCVTSFDIFDFIISPINEVNYETGKQSKPSNQSFDRLEWVSERAIETAHPHKRDFRKGRKLIARKNSHKQTENSSTNHPIITIFTHSKRIVSGCFFFFFFAFVRTTQNALTYLKRNNIIWKSKSASKSEKNSKKIA